MVIIALSTTLDFVVNTTMLRKQILLLLSTLCFGITVLGAIHPAHRHYTQPLPAAAIHASGGWHGRPMVGSTGEHGDHHFDRPFHGVCLRRNGGHLSIISKYERFLHRCRPPERHECPSEGSY